MYEKLNQAYHIKDFELTLQQKVFDLFLRLKAFKKAFK